MPGRGQHTLTLPEDVYRHLWMEYTEQRVELFTENGIATFTGFAVYMMRLGIKRWRDLKHEKPDE